MVKRSTTVTRGSKAWLGLVTQLNRVARSNAFRRSYMWGALVILFGTTLLWAVLGARLQSYNADQVSDPYLFSNWTTFHNASFPGQHTFLLKWPIFWLVSLFGVSQTSLLVTTVGLVLVTVAALAYVLYRIDRRPLVFGTICLGFSLALLLVPAQPYGGGLLPVNMAMITTRNIEYAVYLLVLALFARAKHIKSWDFAAGTALLAVLTASDKLFLSVSLGGALLALVVYAALRAWKYVTFAVHWLAGSIGAAAGSTVLLLIVSSTHLTHFVSSNAAGPYSLVSGAQGVVLGVVYGLLGLLTNLGANPVYDNVILRRLPSELAHRLVSFSIVAYLATVLLALFAAILAWRLVWRVPRTKLRAPAPVATLFALALIWSTVVAFAAFVASNHYYAVDARYMAIGLFALIVAAAVELRKYRWRQPGRLLLVAAGLLVAITIAIGTSVHTSRAQTAALGSIDARNTVVAAALQRHKTDVLVGSYWRVLPIKLKMRGNITALPMLNCTRPERALTSAAWQPNLRTHSFAYLLTLSGSIAGFPDCSVASVMATYGRPNAMQVISGSIANPSEALLFYDQGSQPPVSASETAEPATVLPITLSSLTSGGCVGPTIMNVVAHEDDDLLFMSPDLLHEVHAGDCVRTVYLTAGNDGKGRLYWLSRRLGSEAAYDSMLGRKHVWVEQTVELARGEYATAASPRGNASITLVFLNLPDGDLGGEGFPMSDYQSLAKLQSGAIKSMQTVDGQSSYTASQLVAALVQLMQLYQPSEIHTQADVASSQFPDHSDHIATGKFTQTATAAYDSQESGDDVSTPLKLYIGYPIHGYAPTLSGADLREKEAAFLAYAHYDGSACQSMVQCSEVPTYNAYLTREYTERSVAF